MQSPFRRKRAGVGGSKPEAEPQHQKNLSRPSAKEIYIQPVSSEPISECPRQIVVRVDLFEAQARR